MGFHEINLLAKQRIPFLVISDFRAQQVEVIPLKDLQKHDIEFCIDEDYEFQEHPYQLQKNPLPFELYQQKFEAVIEKIKSGETYILNLTQPTPIQTQLTLKEMYDLANAHYKLRYKDQFICFSPEKFIQIHEDKIHTFPMKGTIDASLEDAEAKILKNEKEMAEHIMIVDLLRNDLSIVAKEVKVEKFRYVQDIEAGEKKLLQVSSHISGKLESSWKENLGDILQALLPAGSISGAPKKISIRTLPILVSCYGHPRTLPLSAV
jgi:para-aminobenzoate synthetase component 1